MSDVNFTPNRGAYTELTPFRYWCQKVLPLVYDDSISYYELLCKVVNYLNITMEDVSTLNDDVTAMYTAYNELQDFVNQYFTDLNVQTQIDNKLDRMAADGSLNALIDPVVQQTTITSVAGALPDVVENQLPAVVEDQIDDVVAQQIGTEVAHQIVGTVDAWLDQNVSAGDTVLDSTLTLYNAAARSNIAGILSDNYGYYLGAIQRYSNFETYRWYVNNNVAVRDTDPSPTFNSIVINPVSAGEKYTIKTSGVLTVSNDAPRYIFTDSNNNVIELSTADDLGAIAKTLTVPVGATKLIINDKTFQGGEGILDTYLTMLVVKGELSSTAEIPDLKADLTQYGLDNALSSVIKGLSVLTVYGVKFTPNANNIINIYGTSNASYSSLYKIYDNQTAIPDWITKGKEYELELVTTNEWVNAVVYYYNSGDTSPSRIESVDLTKLKAKFVVPGTAVGFRLSLFATSGSHVFNDNVEIYVRANKTLSELTAAVNTLNEEIEPTIANVSEMQHDLSQYGIGNALYSVIKNLSRLTVYGVTFTPGANNTIHISGTTDASSSSLYKVYDNQTDIPDWITKGKEYELKVDTTTDWITLSVYYYASGSTSPTRIESITPPKKSVKFVVPDDAVGFRIGLFAIAGSHVIDDDVCVYLCENKTLSELTAISGDKNINEMFTNNTMVDINHRGFSQYMPENTLPAFQMSANYGYKFLECDIQKCLDGYVMLHDGNTNRVTGVSGNVSEMTVAQIQALTVTGATITDAQIPTLEEALDCFKNIGIIPMIELKKETIDVSDVPNIMKILEEWGGKYIITSLEHGFRKDNTTHKLLLEATRRFSSEIPIVVTLWETCTTDDIDKIYNAFGENTAIALYETTNPTSAVIKYAHAKDMKIGTFTPSTFQRYHDLIELGFDFCTSNFLMNNHRDIVGETAIQSVANETFTTKTINLSGVTGNADVVWVNGYVKCTGSVDIQFNDQAYYKYTVPSNGRFVHVNMQIWTRGSNSIYFTINPSNGTDEVTTRYLYAQIVKGVK